MDLVILHPIGAFRMPRFGFGLTIKGLGNNDDGGDDDDDDDDDYDDDDHGS